MSSPDPVRPLHILILSGPTREHLDPVRYLSNASSGRQGFALAAEALRRGHTVDLVQGPVDLSPPPGARVTNVVSARDMLDAALRLHPRCDVLIGAAAVSDYRPAATSERKLEHSVERRTLELVANPDILATLAAQRGTRIHVGFALETGDLIENAQSKLAAKDLDWIVANSPAAIAADAGEFTLISRAGAVEPLGAIDKAELAQRLLDRIEASPANFPGIRLKSLREGGR